MLTLVIVDDEQEIRQGLARYFPWRRLGFKMVATFGNGHQALSYAAEHQPDVMICDIEMPVMNGLEMIRAIRTTSPNTTLVVLSAHKNFEYAQEAMRYGVRWYIVKPTIYDELMDTFAKIRDELASKQTDTDSPPLDNLSADERLIEQVRQYVNRNLRTACLEEAASIVALSPNYLSRFFYGRAGEHFSKYLMRTRMERSAALLADHRNTVYAVSEMVGYSNPRNFTRSFKGYFGITPRQYRRAGRPAP